MRGRNTHYWEAALEGLEMFFDEGMILWSRERFNLLFPSEEIATSSYVLGRLLDLEMRGAISVVDSDDVYIKVFAI
jgi:hypothetical protein